jgi:hypothetical protein
VVQQSKASETAIVKGLKSFIYKAFEREKHVRLLRRIDVVCIAHSFEITTIPNERAVKEKLIKKKLIIKMSESRVKAND